MPEVKLFRIHADAILPRCYEGDVGFDLHAIEKLGIPPHETAVVRTGWALAEEPVISGSCIHGNLRTLLKIEGRSGLAMRGVWPVGGIVDPSYRGEIKVVLFNSSGTTHYISPSDRIAQLVWYPVMTGWSKFGRTVKFTEAQQTGETTRGDKGFGSSGR